MYLNFTASIPDNATQTSSFLATGNSQREIIFKVFLTRSVLAIPLALITSFSNGLVLYLFYKDPKKCIRSSPTSLLVASLALVDFLVGCALEPTDVYYNWSIAFGKKPQIDRKDMQSASAFLLLCSILLLMLITFDRYTAVSQPIKYAHRITKKRVYTSVIFVFIYCTTLIFAVRRWLERYRNELFCGHVDLVLIVTTALFGGIIISLRKQTRKLKRLSVSSDDVFVVQASERERKVTLTLSVMLVTFLACTMPWFIMMQVFDYCAICREKWWVMRLLFILVQANCAINPFICTLRLPRYKAGLKMALSQTACYRRASPSAWQGLQAHRLRKRRSSSYTPNEVISRRKRSSSCNLVKYSAVLTQYQFKNSGNGC